MDLHEVHETLLVYLSDWRMCECELHRLLRPHVGVATILYWSGYRGRHDLRVSIFSRVWCFRTCL